MAEEYNQFQAVRDAAAGKDVAVPQNNTNADYQAGIDRVRAASNDASPTDKPPVDTTQTPPAVAPGVRTPNNQATATDPGAVPPKADAAPSVSDVVGLCEALNRHQQELVKTGPQKIADVYAVEFAPAAMSSVSLIKQGTTDYKKTSTPVPKTAAQKVDPATNKLNTKSYTVQVGAGQQISQLIEQIVRGSTYMTDQSKEVIDPVTQKPIPNPKSNGQTAWYKVSMRAESLGFDEGRNNYAYKITFIVAPYGINQTQSQYFTTPNFRGLHKSYNYWFTGQNNAILNFEQNFNALYRQIFSGTGPSIDTGQTYDPRIKVAKTFQTRSEQSDQGADGKVNEPVANLADSLLSPTDQGSIKIRILGDPGWMPGGEMSTGVDAINYQFSPFLADGAINFDASEVAFGISWNRPADYDIQTGLMNVTQNNVAVNGLQGTQPQDSYMYKATKVKCTFAKGRFEQELEGLLLSIPTPDTAISPDGRPADATIPTDDASRDPNIAQGQTASTDNTENPAVPSDQGDSASNLSPEPSAPPQDPTSNGDISPIDSSLAAGKITPEQAAILNGNPASNTDSAQQMQNVKTAYREYQQTMAPKDQ